MTCNTVGRMLGQFSLLVSIAGGTTHLGPDIFTRQRIHDCGASMMRRAGAEMDWGAKFDEWPAIAREIDVDATRPETPATGPSTTQSHSWWTSRVASNTRASCWRVTRGGTCSTRRASTASTCFTATMSAWACGCANSSSNRSWARSRGAGRRQRNVAEETEEESIVAGGSVLGTSPFRRRW